jgi:hypothetical protein
MRILVCGGRDYFEKEKVFDELNDIYDSVNHIECLIHGGAPGADSLAGEWARSIPVQEHIFKPDWGKHGMAAGPIRNSAMLAMNPDMVVAFPGGSGTADMVKKAIAARVRTIRLP